MGLGRRGDTDGPVGTEFAQLAVMPACQAIRHLRNGFRISCEARPASFEGPQRACHADELEFCVIESGTEKCQIDRGPITILGRGTYDLLAAGTVHSSWAKCPLWLKRLSTSGSIGFAPCTKNMACRS